MRQSPYEPPNSAETPNCQPGSEVPIQEREAQPLYQLLTEETYREYRKEAWSVAHLFLPYAYDIEELIDAVIEELCQMRMLLTQSQIKAYLRQRMEWRAIDELRSRRYKQWRHQLSLSGTTKDGEEQPVVLEQLLVDGAEETLLQQLTTLEKDELTQRRLARLHQAILHIEHPERRACFVLKHTYGMKPAAIAHKLGIPVQAVYTHLRLGFEQVRNFMRKQEKNDAKRQQQKLPP